MMGTAVETRFSPMDSRGHVVIIISGAMLSLVAIMVGLRLYTRVRLVRLIGLSDWVIIFGLVFTFATGVTMAVMTEFGLGKHVSTLTPRMIEQYLVGFYLSIVFYYASLGLIKLGLLLQYYPLVAVRHQKFMVFIIAVVSIWSVTVGIIAIVPCRPISGFWAKDVDAVCIPSLPLWYVNAGGNIITDIIIFALPIPMVWRLQMPRSERLSLIGVFCLGFFTCTISVVRIEFLNLGDDYTYNNIAPAGWSLSELCAGLTCACLPTLRPLLFRVVTPSFKRATSSRNHSCFSSVSLREKLFHSRRSRRAESVALDKSDQEQYAAESIRSQRNAGDEPLKIIRERDPEAEGDARGQVFRNVM